MSFPYNTSSSGSGPSYRIGRLLGFDLRVHPWFIYMMAILIAIMATNAPAGETLKYALSGAITLCVLFSLVVLHELGHAVVARHFGIKVIDITLWPLGGMARMEAIPENARVEGLVAIAGPAVNLALAMLASVALLLTFGLAALTGSPLRFALSLAQVLVLFAQFNLLLGLFNLVPAFPMDGGRLLRAWLGRKGDYLKATERAVRVGRVCAWIMILAAFPTRMYFLPLIGLYVFYAGSRELLMTRLRHGVSPFAGLSGALRWPTGDSAGPDPFVNLMRAAAERRRAAPQGGGDPAHGSEQPPEPKGEGYSEEDIERLERDRGRLRR